jgi:hypothetical protein
VAVITIMAAARKAGPSERSPTTTNTTNTRRPAGDGWRMAAHIAGHLPIHHGASGLIMDVAFAAAGLALEPSPNNSRVADDVQLQSHLLTQSCPGAGSIPRAGSISLSGRLPPASSGSTGDTRWITGTITACVTLGYRAGVPLEPANIAAQSGSPRNRAVGGRVRTDAETGRDPDGQAVGVAPRVHLKKPGSPAIWRYKDPERALA